MNTPHKCKRFVLSFPWSRTRGVFSFPLPCMLNILPISLVLWFTVWPFNYSKEQGACDRTLVRRLLSIPAVSSDHVMVCCSVFHLKIDMRGSSATPTSRDKWAHMLLYMKPIPTCGLLGSHWIFGTSSIDRVVHLHGKALLLSSDNLKHF